MATFTKNDWITGEIITANGLNGAKGFPVLEITEEDILDGEPYYTIQSGLTEDDLLHMVIKCFTAGETNEGMGETLISPVIIILAETKNNEIAYYYLETYHTNDIPPISFYYIPANGILTYNLQLLPSELKPWEI